METSDFDKEKLAQLALRYYDFINPTLRFIRHNENLTYKVTDGSSRKSYLMRIHMPISSFPKDIRYTYAGLKSEMELLNGIYEHTDIAVQRPYTNKAGDDVSVLDVEDQCEPLCCTALSWISGETMNHTVPHWEMQAYQTGVMVAKLHDFSEWWTSIVSLDRPTYDAARLRTLADRIIYGIDIKLISEKQYSDIKKAVAFIANRMKKLSLRSGSYGIIHSDLQKTNLIVDGNKITPIDFCLSGHGYFMFDIGGISADFGPLEITQQFLSGYRTIRPLPEDDMKYVEAFFVQTIIHCMGFHIRNEKMHDWVERRIGPICDDYIRPMLNEKPFYKLI